MRRTNGLCFLCVMLFFSLNSQNTMETTTWLIADLLEDRSSDVNLSGSPKIVDSKYGKAVAFNGVDDALFLNALPLKGFESFTVEMIFKPALDGPFEQRIVHMGEISEDRMLLEIRAIDGMWYFDGFAASGDNKKVLIDETLTHPLNQWSHVALVVTPKSMTTYINGKLELQEPFTFKPIDSGKSSIGVRLNKHSWFKGEIYKIKITSKQLNPGNFMNY